MLPAINEYNITQNFLINKYFFKYYVQIQSQMACTGVNKGYLCFLYNNKELFTCNIKYNSSFFVKIYTYLKELETEFDSILSLYSNDIKEMHSKYDNIEALSSSIGNFILDKSDTIKQFFDFILQKEFIEFLDVQPLNIQSKEKALKLEDALIKYSRIKQTLNEKEKEAKIIKDSMKDLQKSIERDFPFIQCYNLYEYNGTVFNLNMNKRIISKKLNIIDTSSDFNEEEFEFPW